MNNIVIVGNLTADPELRTTQNGIAVCSFTVAVSRRRSGQDGNRESDFIPVVTWRGLAENCAKFLHKGKKVAVSGELQTRRYEDKEGKKRTAFEIQADNVEFLSPKAETVEIDGITGFEEMPNTNLPF